jgi:hypothetical protein
MKNPKILGGVIVVLLIAVAALAWQLNQKPKTLSEKMQDTVHQAAEDAKGAIDQAVGK